MLYLLEIALQFGKLLAMTLPLRFKLQYLVFPLSNFEVLQFLLIDPVLFFGCHLEKIHFLLMVGGILFYHRGIYSLIGFLDIEIDFVLPILYFVEGLGMGGVGLFLKRIKSLR